MNEMGTITPCDGTRYDEIRARAREARQRRRAQQRAAERASEDHSGKEEKA